MEAIHCLRGTVGSEFGDSITGKGANRVYQTFMGASDFVFAEAITLGNGYFLVGAEGYAEAGRQGAERGLSPDAIQGEALITAIGDMVLDRIVESGGVKSIARGAAEGAATNVASGITSRNMDAILVRQLSMRAMEYQGYRAKGLSAEEAREKLYGTELKNIATDGLQGGVIGGAITGMGKLFSAMDRPQEIRDADTPAHAGAEGKGLQDADGNGKLYEKGDINPIEGLSEADASGKKNVPDTMDTNPVADVDNVAQGKLKQDLGGDGNLQGEIDIEPVKGGSGSLPQGISQEQFDEASKLLRDSVGDISDDIVVQGSRASGTAKPTSDIDIAIKVTPEKFDELVNQYFKTPNPGSAKERTMLHAIETGKIQAGEAKLSGLRKLLQEIFGMDVDVSIIR